MALFLSANGPFSGLLSLAGLGLSTLALVKIIDLGRDRGRGERLGLPEHATSQATPRWDIVVLPCSCSWPSRSASTS